MNSRPWFGREYSAHAKQVLFNNILTGAGFTRCLAQVRVVVVGDDDHAGTGEGS